MAELFLRPTLTRFHSHLTLIDDDSSKKSSQSHHVFVPILESSVNPQSSNSHSITKSYVPLKSKGELLYFRLM